MSLASRCVRTFGCILSGKGNVNDIDQLRSFNLCTVRLCTTFRLRYDEDYRDITDESERKHSGKEAVFHNLRSVYDCTKEHVEIMMKNSRELKEVYPSTLVNNATNLKENGLHINNLVTYPWVLGYNPQLLPKAVKYLEAFHDDINVSIPFLVHPYSKLEQLSYLAVREKEGTRIKWLSEVFECDEIELGKSIAKYTYMLTMPRDRILLFVNLLKGAGVAPQYIAKDLCVFRYNTKTISDRSVVVLNADIGPIKPWSLRCPERTFHRMIEKRSKNKVLLGDLKSSRKYLAARLECGDETVSYILKKIPQLRYISGVKTKEILDYLYKVGYSPQEVCVTSRILTRSLNTVKSRFIELEALGVTRPNLLLLCKTKKEYKELIEKRKKER